MVRRLIERLKPKLPMTVAMVMVGGAVLAATVGSGLGERTHLAPTAIVAQRTLQFLDRADGAVVVRSNGAEFAVLQGEQGFLRGTLRSLARYRRMDGLSSAAPFHIAAYADGRITIDDPSTKQHIELEAFGPTNAAVFARLLPLPVDAPARASTDASARASTDAPARASTNALLPTTNPVATRS